VGFKCLSLHGVDLCACITGPLLSSSSGAVCDTVYDLPGPPYNNLAGHHAERDAGAGFCVFNNVAVAAAATLEVWDLERVAIVDYVSGLSEWCGEIIVDWSCMVRWPWWVVRVAGGDVRGRKCVVAPLESLWGNVEA